jgi:lysyl-tRNA synthetase class 2
VRGRPFRTRTGELSILVDHIQILTKSLRPLPEKWHGLSDVETRYRQRYLDLIVSPSAKDLVRTRSRIIAYLRNFLTTRNFLEVETPMMQAIPGGATAKPFETFHHALNRRLYLRIAPELYLKRLLVGGFDRVFEINRNFRNEGISTQHNPEFTMLEFYQAYSIYEDLMVTTEEMLSGLAKEITGGFKVRYGDVEVDLTPPWERMTVREALLRHCGLDPDQIDDRNAVFIKAVEMGLEVDKNDSLGKLWMALFDEVVEEKLWGPVFIHRYPVDVSPLARRNDEDPTVTDRFELYVCGREMANAFTELTDPLDQRSRFEEQVQARASGDEEAHFLDEDFLRALEYGMPPAAGEGIGIDRLVMLLTDSQSIREVILFPHMRPEKGIG